MEKKDERGKKFHQKIKPYVVLQYLLKYTDENHVATGEEIAEAIKVNCEISAERRSIYRDIKEINAVALMRVVLSRVFSHFFTKGVLLTPLM